MVRVQTWPIESTWYVRAASAVAFGVAWGRFGVWGDGKDLWIAVLANTGGPWLLVAFLMGMWAANYVEGGLLGGVTLATAVCTYYAVYQFGDQLDTRYFMGHGVAWLPVAVIGGIVFGVAGSVWKFNSGLIRATAVALLAGALIAESLLNIDDIRSYTSYESWQVFILAVEGFVGIALPFVLLKRGRELVIGVGLTLAFALVGLVVVQFVFDSIRTGFQA